MCLLRFGTAATGGAGSLLSASPASRFWTRTGLSPPKQTLLNFLAPSRAPLSGAPRGGTVADFRGFGPGRPVRASFRGWAAGGLPCAARTWRVLGGFLRVLGAGLRERARLLGALAFRRDGYCRVSGFFRKGTARGLCRHFARAIRATRKKGRRGCFTRTPPSPRRQIDRWRQREERGIFSLYFPLFTHFNPQTICRFICR